VIAEGVENPDQWLGLREMDCELAQGFYFARPQAPEAAEAFLEAEQMAAAFVKSRAGRAALRLVGGSGG
jgi:EAL domain-containing protein (putative c-di-GMP-specific phosphodiesterase class I)